MINKGIEKTDIKKLEGKLDKLGKKKKKVDVKMQMVRLALFFFLFSRYESIVVFL